MRNLKRVINIIARGKNLDMVMPEIMIKYVSELPAYQGHICERLNELEEKESK